MIPGTASAIEYDELFPWERADAILQLLESRGLRTRSHIFRTGDVPKAEELLRTHLQNERLLAAGCLQHLNQRLRLQQIGVRNRACARGCSRSELGPERHRGEMKSEHDNSSNCCSPNQAKSHCVPPS